jgi:glycosyltransferase involved in cell wall biosynthesis
MSICLNMIVKNESRIIQRMLQSIYPFVDSLCICDTGSTDNTVELIHQFAQEKGITNYLVYSEPFRNFEYNRTHALHKCLELPTLPTYILLIDADMVLQFHPNIDKEKLKHGLCSSPIREAHNNNNNHATPDVYFINQGNDAFFYKNARMLRAALLLETEKPKYTGVTHEYLDIPGTKRMVDIHKDVLFILDIGDGGAKNDKFTRDIRLLEEGLLADPTNSRYMFYLANSYRDVGDWPHAAEMYRRCIASNGWVEERWQCHYQLGKGAMAQKNPSEAVHQWLLAYNVMPNRLENLYELIKYYRESSQHVLAYTFYKIAIQSDSMKGSPPVFLFLENDVYDYKLHYEFSVFGYYHNPEKVNMAHHSSQVLQRALVPEYLHANILQNYTFYTPRLYQWHAANSVSDLMNMAVLKAFSDIKYCHLDKPMYSSSTSFAMTSDYKLYVCVRKVNYFIRPDGSYEYSGGIVTKNHLIELDISEDIWKYKHHGELCYETEYDDHYVGIEDLKLFYHTATSQLKFIGTRPLPRDNGIAIGYGEIHQMGEGRQHQFATRGTTVVLSHPNNHRCEKNWVCFEDVLGKEKVIYDWNNQSGISIGDLALQGEGAMDRILDNGTTLPTRRFVESHRIDARNKLPRNVRGSTNGVRVGNEIWFVCHIVSYESLRNYYHLFVVLDASTYEITRVSDVFKLSESKIEYVLGLAYFSTTEKFLIAYSTMDRTTDFALIEKSVLIQRLNMQPFNALPLTAENVVMNVVSGLGET